VAHLSDEPKAVFRLARNQRIGGNEAMDNRHLCSIAFCTASLTVATGSAAPLTLQLYPLTREVRLSNPSSSPVKFVFYEIKSPSGGLNGANGVWTSISDRYDASGNGFIDPVNNWTELSSIATDLSEGVFTGDGGTLAPFRSIGLGRIWNPSIASAASLVPTVALSQGQSTVPMDKELAVDGDYNSDHHVDQQDYSVWRIVFGSRTFPMADGNHNGVVDAGDYTVWRDHLGTSLGSGGAATLVSPVPEPSAALMSATAFTLLAEWMCWKSFGQCVS
jgi:hypothetical protein